MIGKVIRGWNPKQLTAYLMGPGESNEHTRPTVIAAWHGDPGALQPDRVGPGDFDFDNQQLAELIGHLYEPAEAAGLPLRQPAEDHPAYNARGYVWHLPVSIEAEAGTLDHETWAQIARDVMDRTGIAPEGDFGACRWIAVHHGQSTEGNDHIHIAATLVRQDDASRRFTPKRDYFAVGAVMREWEERLGLKILNRGDRSTEQATSRGEQEKAARRATRADRFVAPRTDPTETVRGQLRQAVAETAATTTDTEGFLAGLRERGLLVHLHHDRAGAIDGYAVAMPDDRNRAGQPIFYGGGKLARDLSWPKVAAEFTRHGGVPVAERPAQQSWTFAATQLDGARDVVVRATGAFKYTPYSGQRDIAVAAHRLVATHSQVTALNTSADGTRNPRVAAVWAGHRSARSARLSPHTGHSNRVGSLAAELNAASRNLLALRAISEHGPARTASLELIVALAELMTVIAEWHTSRGQPGGATAARDCGWQLRSQATTNATAPAGPRPDVADRGPDRTAAPPTPGRTARAAPPPFSAPHRRPPTPPTTGLTR